MSFAGEDEELEKAGVVGDEEEEEEGGRVYVCTFVFTSPLQACGP